jgi:hypothetical protein
MVYHGEKTNTNSLILRGETGTCRTIQAEDLVEKWMELTS